MTPRPAAAPWISRICSAARRAGASTPSSASSHTTPTRGPIGWPRKCCKASIGGSSVGWSSYQTPTPEVTMQHPVNRRTFLEGAAVGAAALAWPGWTPLASRGLDDIQTEIERRHQEAVARLQQWIHQPSIAAENNGVTEGCDLTMQLLRDAGFNQVTKVPTDGQPGIFATLDAGAPRTLGVYFMYDVKQVDPAEWSSPPWAGSLVEKPGVGTVLVGRGAVNQKGPEASFLAALHAVRGAGRKLPVNLVLVAEGEEEIGSPHFAQIVRRPEALAALRNSIGIFMPSAAQELDGKVIMTLGAKGVIEVELVSSGERWGRGPQRDIHSSNKARVDSPAWHLVEALATLVSSDGNDPAIDGFADKARPLSPAEKAMIAEAAHRQHRRPRGRVHRARWQDHPPAPGGRQTRPATRPRHDGGRSTHRPQGASGETRLRGYRGQHDRRVRPQQHGRQRRAHSGADGGLPARRDRPRRVAPQRRLLARLCVHRGPAAPTRGSFRARTWQRGARAERVLRGRLEESAGARHDRRGALLRGLPVRARSHQLASG